jgi:hypothetical protein
VAEERNAAVLELRILLLESESESVVGDSEIVYSHRRRRQRRAKRDAFARCTPPLYPYWLVYATAAYPRPSPRGAPLSNWAHCSALRDALAGNYATFLPPSLPSAGGCGWSVPVLHVTNTLFVPLLGSLLNSSSGRFTQL